MEQIDRLVAFAVLMESGEGIISKSPSYIEEKWARCQEENEDRLLAEFDKSNLEKYRTWQILWRSHLRSKSEN